ncbi:MAG: 30S ribosomal protein S16 [Bacteroidetes bacterium]|nr:30S ribosomal protein S16 [Bacteroidota bacterium]
MATTIRLQRHGKKGKPFYYVVVADSRSPRDGKFIERLGSYNPGTYPVTINLDSDRTLYWVKIGAQPSDTCKSILSIEGILLRNHLDKGVAKGAMTEEEAHAKFSTWLAEKEKRNEILAKSGSKRKKNIKKKFERDEPVITADEGDQTQTKEAVDSKEETLAEKPAKEVSDTKEDAPSDESSEETEVQVKEAVEAKEETPVEESAEEASDAKEDAPSKESSEETEVQVDESTETEVQVEEAAKAEEQSPAEKPAEEASDVKEDTPSDDEPSEETEVQIQEESKEDEADPAEK